MKYNICNSGVNFLSFIVVGQRQYLSRITEQVITYFFNRFHRYLMTAEV